jgi:hypothetical protein
LAVVACVAGRREICALSVAKNGETVPQIIAMEDFDFPELDALPC